MTGQATSAHEKLSEEISTLGGGPAMHHQERDLTRECVPEEISVVTLCPSCPDSGVSISASLILICCLLAVSKVNVSPSAFEITRLRNNG